MWNFAWRNLMTRPLRTALALTGLSIPILGVLGLFSLSAGLRNLVGDTLSQIEGVMVLRENAPSPVFSSLDESLAEDLWDIPGISAVAPEVWGIAPPIEDSSFISRVAKGVFSSSREQRFQSILDAIVVQGQDIDGHTGLKGAIYPRKMLPASEGGGRFLNASDKGKAHVVISTKIANDFPITEDGKERPRRAGDTINVGNTPFTVIGVYNTGSMFLDVVLVMDIEPARKVLNFKPGTVSSIYVEAGEPGQMEQVAGAIEAKFPGVDARSMEEFASNFGRILGQLDTFLMMIMSLAVLVGVVGIINTMIMSITERFAEFGVLRTNGWSKLHVLALVTIESVYLGLLAGVLGCLLAIAGTALGNQFVSGGLQLHITPKLLAIGLGLSVVMGTLGGLYPAWRAARLVPMDAIRLGGH